MARVVGVWCAAAAAAAAAGCGGSAPAPRGGKAGSHISVLSPTIALRSPAFGDGSRIPVRFTCDGVGHSPPVAWSAPPRGTAQLVVTVFDSDANFTHWTVSLSPRERALPEGVVPAGAVQGRNSFGRIGYGGPCPPRGAPPHHYQFTLYALRRREALRPGYAPSAPLLRPPILIATGVLTGTYSR